METIEITPEEIVDLVESFNGKFFSVVFTKVNGEERKMTGRTNVRKYVKQRDETPEERKQRMEKIRQWRRENNLVAIWEPANPDPDPYNRYRQFSTKRTHYIKANGKLYKVVK